jgi:hypothetical protein
LPDRRGIAAQQRTSDAARCSMNSLIADFIWYTKPESYIAQDGAA